MTTSTIEHPRLLPGYAETSTKRHPKCPETVIVTDTDCAAARYVGPALIDGSAAWLAFKIPGRARYYFQYRPW